MTKTDNLFNDAFLTRVLSLQESIRIAADIMLHKYEDSSIETDPADITQLRDFALGLLEFLEERAPSAARHVLHAVNMRRGPPISSKQVKQTMAEMWAEMAAGKISVYLADHDPNGCLLFADGTVRKLELAAADQRGRTFEFKPEDYRVPTAADIEQMMSSAR